MKYFNKAAIAGIGALFVAGFGSATATQAAISPTAPGRPAPSASAALLCPAAAIRRRRERHHPAAPAVLPGPGRGQPVADADRRPADLHGRLRRRQARRVRGQDYDGGDDVVADLVRHQHRRRRFLQHARLGRHFRRHHRRRCAVGIFGRIGIGRRLDPCRHGRNSRPRRLAAARHRGRHLSVARRTPATAAHLTVPGNRQGLFSPRFPHSPLAHGCELWETLSRPNSCLEPPVFTCPPDRTSSARRRPEA